MKRIMLNIPSLKDKKAENLVREIVRQTNQIFDDIEADLKKIKEGRCDNE